MFISFLADNPAFYISWVAVVMFSICCHEAAHAYVAWCEGDDTAVKNGYLTLNPLRVMGLPSIIMLGLFGFAWGAVPVQPHRFRRPSSHLRVSLAGPSTNLVLVGVSACGYLIASRTVAPQISDMFMIGVQANAFLMLFNMLPIPIFDGWELYSKLFPALRRIPAREAQQWGMGILLVILFTGLHTHIWRAAMQIADVLTI